MKPRYQTLLQAGILTAASLLLIVRCWNAPFLPYDDGNHIFGNPLVTHGGPLASYFKLPQKSGELYLPVTLLSFRLDYLLFDKWASPIWGSPAPMMRIVTCLYHAGAALILLALMRRIGLSNRQAFFVALVFAAHPLACEDLCWVTERKSVLAGLFGFASVWAYVALSGRLWCVPMAALLFLLALWSKASALGILPLFAVIELIGSERLRGESPLAWPDKTRLTRLAIHLVPLGIIAILLMQAFHAAFSGDIVPPPGGTLFNAMLTDFKILDRYLFNIILPVRLSFQYLVEPITSVLSADFILFAGVFFLSIGLTCWISKNRARTLFGWLWFVGALGPSMNLIPIPNLMQDRFVYLSIPGALIVLVETIEGLRARWPKIDPRHLAYAASVYVMLLLSLGIARSVVFNSLFDVFNDAVEKEPRSGFARWGLGQALLEKYDLINKGGDPMKQDPETRKKLAALFAEHKQQYKFLVDECPDAPRMLNYPRVAVDVGHWYLETNEPALAEHYFEMCDRALVAGNDIRAEALRSRASIKLGQAKLREGYGLADAAVFLNGVDMEAHFIRACAAIALVSHGQCADRDPRALLQQARNDLEIIPIGSDFYTQAQEVLKRSIPLEKRIE